MVRSQLLASLAVCGAARSVSHPLRRTPADGAFLTAVRAVQAAIAADNTNPAIATTGITRLYHHGRRTRTAVVLLHGFTNCPQQFDELARRLFRRGCNVYVPRLPFHGFRDRLTMALGALSVDVIGAVTDAYFATARNLGERITVLGLSLGGAMALALAQKSPIDHAIAVAPFIMPIGVPAAVGLPVMRTLAGLPDYYVWWDPRVREQCRPLYAYPGFPTRALATIVQFAERVVETATIARPLGRHCTLVTNSHESAVNNQTALDLLGRWNQSNVGYASVVLGGLGAPRHDIIDPTTFPDARSLVYPVLEDLVLD